MIKVIDKKATGKTGRLLLLAKENNGTLICKNPDKIRAKAHNYGIIGVEIVSFTDYFNGNYTNDLIYIDEIDDFLMQLNSDIRAYTISEDD